MKEMALLDTGYLIMDETHFHIILFMLEASGFSDYSDFIRLYIQCKNLEKPSISGISNFIK